jgi:multicomponent Na+:H+ antiporter subunit F
MISLQNGFFEWTALVLAAVFVGSMGITVIRLLKGPSLADRVIALDVLIMAAVATIGVTASAYGQTALLDVAVAVATVTFIGTVGAAWYLQRKASP